MVNKTLEYETEHVGAERFVISINDFKQKLGFWYSLFVRKILPVLLYFIPINVVLEQTYLRINRLYPNDIINSTFLTVTWIIALLLFATAAILVPKVATVIEFAFGFAFLFYALRYNLITNLLGNAVLIGLILFLFVKLVFLLFEIIRLIAFAGDKKNNIERDESGRVVRASDEEVFFTQEETIIDSNPKTDDEVVLVPNHSNTEDYNSTSAADNDFFFG
ncbi:MAG: hypothetical protein VZQ55_08540 [Ruminococcus sp.]|nr:hypothetical protein [Ruminococcus sp.]